MTVLKEEIKTITAETINVERWPNCQLKKLYSFNYSERMWYKETKIAVKDLFQENCINAGQGNDWYRNQYLFGIFNFLSLFYKTGSEIINNFSTLPCVTISWIGFNLSINISYATAFDLIRIQRSLDIPKLRKRRLLQNPSVFFNVAMAEAYFFLCQFLLTYFPYLPSLKMIDIL